MRSVSPQISSIRDLRLSENVSLSTSMTAHNHCLMYSNEWCTLRTSVGARQARSMNHSRANNKYFARNIKNRLSWNWINAKEIGLKQVLWTKAKTSRTSRCKSGAETARWITSQCSMPLAIFSLFLLSKLVGNYIDEHSGPMHACFDRWMTVRGTGEDGKFFLPQLLSNDLVVAMWVCGCENIGYRVSE